MQELGAEMETHDLDRVPLSAAELEALIGDRDHKLFLNTRNELYRGRQMGEKPPLRSEAIALMAENPNLIKRPILICDGKMELGFDEKAYRKLLS